MLKLYNSLTKKVEEFTPLKAPKVTMYSCGPTVNNYQHIGNYRKYTGDDILKRVLEANGFNVKHVMNITDVGHLQSDADEGDDKLEVGAKERGMTVWEVAKFFEDDFLKWIDKLNIIRSNVLARATEHINEQIKLIKKLEKRGFIYKTDQAIYFDISKFPNYTKLSTQKLEEKLVGARGEVVTDKNKKHPADFALWFFTVGHFKNHTMRWSSPWGEGFPGWHIECSAMSMEYLGDTIDIHTGGVDHIPVHHTNEIAQSEGTTGKLFVKYWVHHEFLLVGGEKMAKAKKNFFTIKDAEEKGFEPLALRYLYLTAHYRDKLNFTWQSLEAAQNALNNLRGQIRAWEKPKANVAQFWQKFLAAANNDLNMPQALAILWEMVKSDSEVEGKSAALLKMDTILGLKLDEYLAASIKIPVEVKKLIEQREKVRKSGNFTKADELRLEIKRLGFEIEDTPAGPVVKVS